MSKILVKQSNPLYDLLRNVKEQGKNPVNVRQLREYFDNVNNILSGTGDKHAAQELDLPPEGSFPTQPLLGGKKFGSLNTFRDILDEAKNLQEQDVADKELLERILSGEEFADMEKPKSELGSMYDAIRENTSTHMEDIESEYEQYKKLMGIIGNPIMGFKDFAQAKGWIHPNDNRVGYLGLDDRQLLEQIRGGTPPPIHGSQIGDMSLQEFERKVPMDYGKISSQPSTHEDFMNVLKASLLKQMNHYQGGIQGNSDWYEKLEKKQFSFKTVANRHQEEADGDNYIRYFDGDTWDAVHGSVFGKKNNPLSNVEAKESFDKMVSARNDRTEQSHSLQGKSLAQLQDFVAHPAVKKHIEDMWDSVIERNTDLQSALENEYGASESRAKQFADIFEMHKTNQSDPFKQAIENEMKHGQTLEQTITDVENMPYFHTEHSLQHYGYLPNYSQKLDSVQQMNAVTTIDDNGMTYSMAPQSDLTEQFG